MTGTVEVRHAVVLGRDSVLAIGEVEHVSRVAVVRHGYLRLEANQSGVVEDES